MGSFALQSFVHLCMQEEAGSERLLENAEQYGVYFAAALLNANVSINQTDIQDNTIARDNISEH